MIESTTIKQNKIDCGNRIQPEQKPSLKTFGKQSFDNATRQNPCHDGCGVSEKELQARSDKVSEADEISVISEQNSGVDKTSGGNCPGSNIIANILQELIQALEAVRVGR